jgi:oxygen-dependent protoporphyrinogen oxidase
VNSQIYDNLIVGGGISGLGLGHLCVRRGLRTLLLESATQVGGCIHSHAFTEADGYWLEMGAHTCYNSYGHLLQAAEDLGLTGQLRLKEKVSFKLLEQNAVKSIFSRLHPLELALSLPRLWREDKTGRSVRDYYSRVLGQRNYAQLFGPAFNAVICQPADPFPADMLFRRKPRRKEMPRSFTLPHGLSTIAEAMAAQAGLETRTEQSVTAISHAHGVFVCHTAGGEELRAQHLSLAVPPDIAGGLLTEAFAPLATALKEIRMSEIETVALVVAGDNLRLKPLAGLIAPDDAFYAAVSRDYLPDPRYRGFSFHFRPGQLDAQQQRQRILDVLGIDEQHIIASARKTNRLPALRVGHVKRVAHIDQLLQNTGLILTGNYFIGVSIEDCLTRSAAEFKRLFA